MRRYSSAQLRPPPPLPCLSLITGVWSDREKGERERERAREVKRDRASKTERTIEETEMEKKRENMCKHEREGEGERERERERESRQGNIGALPDDLHDLGSAGTHGKSLINS